MDEVAGGAVVGGGVVGVDVAGVVGAVVPVAGAVVVGPVVDGGRVVVGCVPLAGVVAAGAVPDVEPVVFEPEVGGTGGRAATLLSGAVVAELSPAVAMEPEPGSGALLDASADDAAVTTPRLPVALGDELAATLPVAGCAASETGLDAAVAPVVAAGRVVVVVRDDVVVVVAEIGDARGIGLADPLPAERMNAIAPTPSRTTTTARPMPRAMRPANDGDSSSQSI